MVGTFTYNNYYTEKKYTSTNPTSSYSNVTCTFIEDKYASVNHLITSRRVLDDELSLIKTLLNLEMVLYVKSLWSEYVKPLKSLLLKPMHLRCVILNGHGWANR